MVADEATEWAYDVDLVVVGSGAGGLTAACAAVEEGLSVLVLEVSGYMGGGSIYSSSVLHSWGYDNWADFDEYTEGRLHARGFGRTFIETYRGKVLPFYLDVLHAPMQEMSMPNCGPAVDYALGDAEGGIPAFFAALVDYVEQHGGTVLTNTRASRLVIGADGSVLGVVAQNTQDGSTFLCKGASTLLACGGFQANKLMVAQYIGPDTISSKVRVPPTTRVPAFRWRKRSGSW